MSRVVSRNIAQITTMTRSAAESDFRTLIPMQLQQDSLKTFRWKMFARQSECYVKISLQIAIRSVALYIRYVAINIRFRALRGVRYRTRNSIGGRLYFGTLGLKWFFWLRMLVFPFVNYGRKIAR